MVVVLVLAPLDWGWGLFDPLYKDSAPPRTHPLTWACIFLALLATVNQRPMRITTTLERQFWTGVVLIASTKYWLAPQIEAVLPQLDFGTMGANTAMTALSLAIGQLLRNPAPRIGIFFAAGALFLTAVSLNGVLLGNAEFYGQMALPTALALFALSLANLVRYARLPAMRLILHDTPAGRLVRAQLLLWVALAAAMPLGLRMVEFSRGSGFALLYTTQMAVIFTGIIHFGVRFARLLENSRKLERELLRDTETDQLTQVGTRRAALAYCADYGWRHDLGVIIADIDRFKQVNDEHGHAVGDRVLVSVAETLRSNLRLRDLVVRWGGEEFVLLIPLGDDLNLSARVEELRKDVELAHAAHPELPPVTASFGATVMPASLEADLDAAMTRADAALYRAKAEGRNRVVFSDDDPGVTRSARAA